MTTKNPASTTALATLSIQRDPQFSQLRICAQTCVDKNNNNSDLEGFLECGDSKIYNECYCREDLRPKATTFLSSCVISRCKYNDRDLTSVLNLYDGYCEFKPATASASTTKKSTKSAEPTSSTRSTTTPSASASPSSAITRVTPLPTSSTSFLSSSLPISTGGLSIGANGTDAKALDSSSASLPAGAIAGIVIGVIGAVVLAIGILMWFCRRGMKAEGSEQQGDQPETYRPWKVLDEGVDSRSGQSLDLGPVAAKMPHEVKTYPRETFGAVEMGDTGFRGMHEVKVQPHQTPGAVEICDTGFRAELSAGEDVIWRKDKT